MNQDLRERELEILRETVADLRHRLEEITASMVGFEMPGLDELRFTPSERAVVKMLHDHLGHPIRKDRMLAALYASRITDREIPDDKIADVFICKIRAKLKGKGWKVVTHWGVGWSLHKEGAGNAE